jgi:hypothetical protein
MVDLVRRQKSSALSMRWLTHPVAKLDHETDPPDRNSHHADSDTKRGCRRDRTGENPDDASADDAERNEIAEDCVAHLDTRKGPLAIARGPSLGRKRDGGEATA